MNKKFMRGIIALLLVLSMLGATLVGCDLLDGLNVGNGGDYDDDKSGTKNDERVESTEDEAVYGFASVEGIPDYSGKPYVELNGNMPEFTDDEIVSESYEFYSELDSLGRCGYTMACVGIDIMPTEDRESISSVKPSGWVNNKYDTDLVDGGYIYNRCHLIGFQLTGENANEKNLITGTRYLNIEGMLVFENMIADYVKETENHVMYRVTPIFVGNNLVASGVQLEAWSVEDEGEGICFNVFSYNVQPGIYINYATGENRLNEDYDPDAESDTDNCTDSGNEPLGHQNIYILNTNTKKVHTIDCPNAANIKETNRSEYRGLLQSLIDDGYSPCGTCDPT